MYTLEEIRKKRKTAEAAKLAYRHLLNDTEAVQRDCNGIGAAWMWDNLRAAISNINPSLVVVADIHDRMYSIGGTGEDRKHADEVFEANGMLMADYRYGWYDPRRYIVRKQVHKFYLLLRVCGGAAWHYKEVLK